MSSAITTRQWQQAAEQSINRQQNPSFDHKITITSSQQQPTIISVKLSFKFVHKTPTKLLKTTKLYTKVSIKISIQPNVLLSTTARSRSEVRAKQSWFLYLFAYREGEGEEGE